MVMILEKINPTLPIPLPMKGGEDKKFLPSHEGR
ncbi:MAG: hypothetical protein ACI8PD_001531 [Nitrospinales bacterium]|jgi:hypothetical protein